MTAVSAPFGLRPSYHPSGIPRPKQGTITSGLAANIFMNAPVKFVEATGCISVAAPTERALGAFQGVEYINAQGRPTVGNYWPTGTVGTVIRAFYHDDPWLSYEIQANASLAQTSMGHYADWTAQAGSTGTGLSTVMLDVATLLATINGLQIWGITEAPDNLFGDAFTVVQVRIAEHQFLADSPTLA